VTETDRVRAIYDRNAERYDSSERSERIVFGDGVRRICGDARGDVLELAVGSGRNLRYYPDGVRLTGVELSEEMLRIARERASQLSVDADLRQGDVQSLAFDDASFDTVVCTFSLCTIPDERRALVEARRVLRPGGLLLLAEHVRSPNRIVRLLERLAEPVLQRIYGDHLLRDPLDHLESVGFTVARVERSRLGIVERVWAHA
jgi:ubiquinone/menaquinone biosynthesis C-methylase UbiE